MPDQLEARLREYLTIGEVIENHGPVVMPAAFVREIADALTRLRERERSAFLVGFIAAGPCSPFEAERKADEYVAALGDTAAPAAERETP